MKLLKITMTYEIEIALPVPEGFTVMNIPEDAKEQLTDEIRKEMEAMATANHGSLKNFSVSTPELVEV